MILMEMPWNEIAPVAVTGVFGFLVAWLTAKTQKRGARENMLIDQLQEERTSYLQEIKDLKSELVSSRDRKKQLLKEFENSHQVSLENMEKIQQLLTHIWKLEQHILKELPPPPPKMEE